MLKKNKTYVFDLFRAVFKIRFLEKIIVKLTIDKQFGSIITKVPPNYYQYKKRTIRFVERNNVNYELDISDLIDWYIYFGFKEKARTELYNLVNESNIVFDIGANIGEVTLNFAKIVGDSGTVFSFEPESNNYKKLENNIKLNSFKSIVLNNIGLADKNSLLKIYNIEERNCGMNRILDNGPENDFLGEIEVVKLDEYIANNNISKVDLVKIDVEGYEYNVLKGSNSLLKELHPILFIELDDNNLKMQGDCALDLIKLLCNLNYSILHAENKKELSINDNYDNCHFDIICKYQNNINSSK